MQNEPELDEIAAAILLGRVNAPEQEIYHTARAVLAAVTPQNEDRAREEGAKAMQASVTAELDKCCEPCPQCRDARAALDPAQIAGGEK